MKTKLVLRKNVGRDILKEMHGSSVKQEIFTKLVGKLFDTGRGIKIVTKSSTFIASVHSSEVAFVLKSEPW